MVSPSRSISGRNDAGLALRDVGATSTTERVRQLVGLDDHAISSALLLVAGPARQAELVDVTPQHA